MRHLIAPALLLSALALPAAAIADPVSDCASDGSVDGHYTNAQLKKALNNIPGDVDEYSDCRAAIQAAIKSSKSKSKKKGGATAGASSSGGSAGGDGANASGAPVDLNGDGKIDSSERKAAKTKQLALNTDAKRKQTEDKLGAPKTDPAKVGALDASDTSNGLPTPVLLAIIALALLALAAGTILLGRRNPAFAQALRKIPTPRVPIPKRFRR